MLDRIVELKLRVCGEEALLGLGGLLYLVHEYIGLDCRVECQTVAAREPSWIMDLTLMLLQLAFGIERFVARFANAGIEVGAWKWLLVLVVCKNVTLKSFLLAKNFVTVLTKVLVWIAVSSFVILETLSSSKRLVTSFMSTTIVSDVGVGTLDVML